MSKYIYTQTKGCKWSRFPKIKCLNLYHAYTNRNMTLLLCMTKFSSTVLQLIGFASEWTAYEYMCVESKWRRWTSRNERKRVRMYFAASGCAQWFHALQQWNILRAGARSDLFRSMFCLSANVCVCIECINETLFSDFVLVKMEANSET